MLLLWQIIACNALLTTGSLSNWSTQISVCLAILVCLLLCISKFCVFMCLQAVIFPRFFPLPSSLSCLSTTWPPVPAGLQVISSDWRASASNIGCVQTSSSHAIMSFSAYDFPWNDKVAWQIHAWENDDWMLQILACASLLLSIVLSGFIWPVPA